MKMITYPELKKMMEENKKILLIDLRDHEEYAEHHINNAINIPEEKFIQIHEDEDELFKEIVGLYREDYKIILYCMRGNISMLAVKKMHRHKIEALSLYGGINEYDKYLRYEKNI